MRQTLFYIPHEIAGLPVFGFGWALAVWLVVCAVWLVLLVRRQGWSPDTLGYLPVLAMVAAVIAFLLPSIEAIDQDTKVILGLPIRGYGFMVLLGVLSGVGVMLYRAKQYNINYDTISALAFWVFLCGIAGARIFYVAQYWENFQAPTIGQTIVNMFKITEGGLVVYGSLIGAVSAFLAFCLIKRLPMLLLADMLAPAMMIGLSLGRLGCLMNGCCYGGQCDLPWAVSFPAGSPADKHQIQSGATYGFFPVRGSSGEVVVGKLREGSPPALAGLKAGAIIELIDGVSLHRIGADGQPIDSVALAQKVFLDEKRESLLITTRDQRNYTLQRAAASSLPVHPTQIYSSINAALLCLVLFLWFPFRRKDGEVFAGFLVLYPISRFLEEMIRDDETGIGGTGLTISQLVSLALLVAAAAMWVWLRFGKVKQRSSGNTAALVK